MTIVFHYFLLILQKNRLNLCIFLHYASQSIYRPVWAPQVDHVDMVFFSPVGSVDFELLQIGQNEVAVRF